MRSFLVLSFLAVLVLVCITGVETCRILVPTMIHSGQPTVVHNLDNDDSILVAVPKLKSVELPPIRLPDCFDTIFGIPARVPNSFPPCDEDGNPYYWKGQVNP